MSKPAAKMLSKTMGEPTFPPTMILDGEPTVLVEGIPIARLGSKCMPHTRILPPFDTHTEICIEGSSTVMVGGVPAVRMGDKLLYGDVVIEGSSKVLIGG